MPPIPIEARRRHTAANLAALTLANAFIFQEELSQANELVEPIRRLLAKSDFQTAVADHWKYICDEINYVPIFHIAREILVAIPSNHDSSEALAALAKQALQIVSERAALRHDLMGRVYHYLLLEAKYLGTYYTSVSAATLLLKLALRPDRWAVDWTDIDAVRNFRAADLACGTGTLLMAVSQAITDNFIRLSAARGRAIDGTILRKLHQAIMEDVLHGYDVLPSAVHLTASTLALLAPEIAFRKMQLYSMPLGKLPNGKIYLGSIEFLGADRVATQLDFMGGGTQGAAGALSGRGTTASTAPLPRLNLCVMNPPFVRSVNSNLLFGSMPQFRREMQNELARRVRNAEKAEVLATTTAGLGAIFTAIGDQHIEGGGRIALVLPAALTTGGAWAKTRTLLENKYELECVVASHDAERWSFSENTDLSEVLVIARKLMENAPRNRTGSCTFVSLWRNPTATADALAVGEAINGLAPAPIGSSEHSGHGASAVLVGRQKWGEAVSIPLDEIFERPLLGSAFAQTELVRANWHLRSGILGVPGSAQITQIPL
jgi:hypothetical protein